MLKLIVLYVANIETSKTFYEALGLRFQKEKHGKGPEHYAAEIEGVVLEIYPRGKGEITRTRLGLKIQNWTYTKSQLQPAQILEEKNEQNRALLIDPDENKVELEWEDKLNPQG